jgi:hypothetical protein
MSSWTADIEWHAGPARRRQHLEEWAAALEPRGRVSCDAATGTVTATLVVEARSLQEALPTAVHIVEAAVGHRARVRRIAATASYHHVLEHDRLLRSSDASGPADEPQRTGAPSSSVLTTAHSG